MPRPTVSSPSQRMLRVAEQVRHALSETLQRGEIIDPLIENTVVSVSEVRMSPDLRVATAFVSPLGTKDTGAVIDALNKHAKFVRGRVSGALRLVFGLSGTFVLAYVFIAGPIGVAAELAAATLF